ncbi:MAG: hypothetical protein IPK94_10420 [Saprospiraceae bacterium]|nr:hypothetical protein [Saprospiraceae bacterium]
MRLIYFLFGICGYGLCLSQGWAGAYQGTVNGDPTTVNIILSGEQISGTYVETSNEYDIKGQFKSATHFEGELLMKNTGLQLGTFKAMLDRNVLTMDMLLLGVTPLKASFTRMGSEANQSNAAIQQPTVTATVTAPHDGFDRDPAVIGHWSQQEVMNSGFGDNAASLAMIYFLAINADGTFIQEKASAGGGSTWSSNSRRELDVQGHWYTKDQIMYVRPAGQAQYIRLNRYLFHEGALVFKTDQGKYLIWNRGSN